MDSEWNRIAKDFLFEKSVRDKNNNQITLLQSWRKIVAIIVQKTNTMIKTKKHYSYNVTTALDKLAKQQKLKILVLSENDMYNLLIEKFGKDSFFKNWDDDIEYCEGYAEDDSTPNDSEEYDTHWEEELEESEDDQ